MRDYDLILKSAGLVASSAAGTVSGAAFIADVGAGKVEGQMVIDVTAIEVDTGSELYEIQLQGSSESDFSSSYDVLAQCSLGATNVTPGDVLAAAGRFVVPFSNHRNGVTYQYLREYCSISGTVATGINFSCFLTP